MIKNRKTPVELNKLAAFIVDQTTNEEHPPPQEKSTKNPAAVALGRLGGLKGGIARANKLSPQKRKEIAQKAAKKRWQKKSKV
jgi:hypothetical protein